MLLWWLALSGGEAAPPPVGPASAGIELQFYLSPSYATDGVLVDGAVGHWRLDEVSGTVAADSSGNSHTGTYVNTPTLGVAGPLADGSTAASFASASAERVDIADHADLRSTSFSVEAWFKQDVSDADYEMIVSKTGASWADGYGLFTIGGVVHFFVNSYSTSVNAAFSYSAWHYVVGTWNGTTARLYLDGVAVGTPITPTLVHSLLPVRIASEGGLNSSYCFNGSLDEVAIYPTALSATRVAAHYALRTVAPGWVNMLSDVRTMAPLVCEYGIQGSTPADRTASAGTLEGALDNSTGNSGGLLGYYSPLHSAKRLGYGFNIPVRLKLSFAWYESYKFLGSLSDIVPSAGVHEDRLVHFTALDWMDDAARYDLPDLAAQLNKRPDELVTLILDALPVADQPIARSIETGAETYNIALDGGATGSRPKVREVLNQIALSEFGYVYLKGDPATGGVLTFEGRHHRAANPTTLLSLTDADIDRGGLVVPGSRDEIYSRVEVFVSPTRVDTAATTVLYSLQTTSTLVHAGAVNNTLFGMYRDPVNNDQIGGTETVNPAATTDYTMNTLADGNGTDLTGSFSVIASRTGLGVRYTITNNGTQSGYITKLQQRGKGIYRYTLPIGVDVPSGYGSRKFSLDMPFQNDTNVAADVAKYLSGIFSTPFAHVPSVRFMANRSGALMAAAIQREPGDRIAVSETVTGVSAQFTINRVRLELQAPDLLWCTWGLEPATAQRFWLLGRPGASELGVTTYLGF